MMNHDLGYPKEEYDTLECEAGFGDDELEVFKLWRRKWSGRRIAIELSWSESEISRIKQDIIRQILEYYRSKARK